MWCHTRAIKWSLNWGVSHGLSCVVYLIVVFYFGWCVHLLSTWISIHIAHVFVYWIWNNASCITCFNFLEHIQAFKLGERLIVYPMTINQDSSSWNAQLKFECLFSEGRHKCFYHFLQYPYTAAYGDRYWANWRPFWDHVENLFMLT